VTDVVGVAGDVHPVPAAHTHTPHGGYIQCILATYSVKIKLNDIDIVVSTGC